MALQEDPLERLWPDPLTPYDEGEHRSTKRLHHKIPWLRQSEFERLKNKREELLWPDPEERG